MNISAMARAHGITPITAHMRIRRGWCWFKACTTPPRPYRFDF